MNINWVGSGLATRPSSFMSSYSSFLLSATIFILILSSSTIIADPRTVLVSKFCNKDFLQDSAKYVRSFQKLLDPMREKMKGNGFATGEDGDAPNRIYVLAQCMGDLSEDDCATCFIETSAHLPGCFPHTGGRVYLDGCFMRFDNYSFFQETTSPQDVQICSEDVSSEQYVNATNLLVSGLVEMAPSKEGYDAENTPPGIIKVYGMANCWNTLSKDQCAKCLSNASYSVLSCLPSADGRALNAGCFLRYSSYQFANKSVNNQGHFLKFLAYILGGVGFCLLAIILGIHIGKTIYRRRQERLYEKEVMNVNSSESLRSLRFKYSTLQKATEDFSPEHKIGQGGYGEVFRGVFPDGREIAIKRLFASSKHNAEEIRNEMDIISQSHHRNLVRFLGFCFADDNLLVYEFLANKSLDQMLFDPEKKKELDWKRRLGIIKGTAEGLEYLHKDCQVKIIHRDIKASNILLDLKCRPKISDFGLARFNDTTNQGEKERKGGEETITADQETIAAGTLGYMAPECLAGGALTDKVDVYSYGVVVLEIVCGVKNSDYYQSDYYNPLCTLVTSAWKHFQENRVVEMIDKSMEIVEESPEKEEVVRVVQMGLLCTQESPSQRPSMTNVVQMLRQREMELPTPSRPPFLEEDDEDPDPEHQEEVEKNSTETDYLSLPSSNSSSSNPQLLLVQQHSHSISVDSSSKYFDAHINNAGALR
ncbi:cysteine-rich receptor-like protein kinase 46 [Impatiens glandulifera]|uniref:cysteine-rich receptor-like protein kinase 46 n=1 Tax=Impatiens glandulifera TaxID=253017 RepID=UPI001FB12F84|nr:cysteine-rich receptor-like protein kinase 46 [Impatiens glandulifera]